MIIVSHYIAVGVAVAFGLAVQGRVRQVKRQVL